MSPRLIRVLIVDDSMVMRTLLRMILSEDKRMEVAGTASDGRSALEAIKSIRPDIVLLDVEMPFMNGLETLKELQKTGIHLPVIMCSALTQRGGQVTIEALANGAADYVTKPTGQASREVAIEGLRKELIPKILALSVHGARYPAHDAEPARTLPPHSPLVARDTHTEIKARTPLTLSQAAITRPEIVVIGVSTGGPAALDVFISALPADFQLPILIVQHMPELFTQLLAERLNNKTPLHVREAANGDLVMPGTVYIARGSWHMELRSCTEASLHTTGIRSVIHLTQDPPENHCRPSVDVLFRSAANIYGPRVLAVVLTGMGSDGLNGSRTIREHGGTILAQDENTSVIWGMPGAVAQAGLAHAVLPLSNVVGEILYICGRPHSAGRTQFSIADAHRQEA